MACLYASKQALCAGVYYYHPLHYSDDSFPDLKDHLHMQHFEGFDPEGFSLWFCDYKYPEENTVNYIVMNKVSTHPQRLCIPFCRRHMPASCFARVTPADVCGRRCAC